MSFAADPSSRFVLLASGRFPPDRVYVAYDPRPRPTTPELEASIAAEWDKQQTLAKGTQRVLFNGEMLRYLSHVIQMSPAGERFEMTVGPTCYRDFVGTNLYGAHWLDRVGWRCFSNAVGTTATLLTADGMICYGRRSQRVAFHAGHVHTFGGALERADRGVDGSVDVFASVLRELREELGLLHDDMLDLICVGLIRDTEIFQPELLFEARVALTADSLRRRWKSAESSDEHEELVFFPDQSAAIHAFITSCDRIAPVAIGALMIHDKLRQL